jgi:hypothetical protein
VGKAGCGERNCRQTRSGARSGARQRLISSRGATCSADARHDEVLLVEGGERPRFLGGRTAGAGGERRARGAADDGIAARRDMARLGKVEGN